MTWMGAGKLGLEVDYHLAPNFYQITGGSGNVELLNLDSSVQTLMANVVLGAPIGGTSGPGIRPYAAAGIGLRADARYFRGLQKGDDGGEDLEDFDFWRATLGFTFRFGQ